jgi:hypothetical protein
MMPIKRDPTTGRFVKGTKGGPGRPPKAKEEKYLAMFRETVPPAEFAKATLAVLRKAQEGDVKAWTALARYALGVPVVRAEVDINQRSLSVELQALVDKGYDIDGDAEVVEG